MKRFWHTVALFGLALGLALVASVPLLPRAAAGDQPGRPAAMALAGEPGVPPVRAQSGDLPRETDDERGSPPVFEFVCALIGFVVVVYLVVRRMRATEPASNPS